MTHANEKDLELDSAYFIAFDMARNALKKGLAESSDLNVTQYRTLMKILGAKGEPLSQARLKEALRLAANVVTGALSVLEEHGYVMRESGRDARTRYISITPAGISHIDEVNEAVVRRLYEDFPTKNPTFRTILEAAIAAGAQIDPLLNPSATVRHPASRALVAIEFIQQETERALKTTCGASFNECRARAIPRQRGACRRSPRPAQMGATPRVAVRPEGGVRQTHRRGRVPKQAHRQHHQRTREHAAVDQPDP